MPKYPNSANTADTPASVREAFENDGAPSFSRIPFRSCRTLPSSPSMVLEFA